MDAMIDRKLRILSFNWHEPYLCMLAATGHQFYIFEPLTANGLSRRWDERMRPLPENVTIVSEPDMREMLEQEQFDLIICQNARDIIAVSERQNIPKVLVFHNKLTTEIGLGGNSISRESYLKQLEPHLRSVTKVFISQSKKEDWAMDGSVIPPGINAQEYSGYEGEKAQILRVGNMLRERDLMMGFSEQEAICEGFSSSIVGQNPTLGTSVSGSWEELKSHYRQNRLYLNTTKEPYEDGYNLSMLEAMATGMPVVSLANPTSPLSDGRDGFVSADIETLRGRVSELLADRELALKMGKAARECVIKKFPIKKFVARWNEVIENVINVKDKCATNEIVAGPAKVWMDYAYYPATTAHYLRRAFEKKHSVVTSGGSITPEVIKMWNLEKMKAEIFPQDIPRSEAKDAQSIFERLPQDFNPEFFLWVETGLELPPAGIEKLNIPKAAYFIDSHINLKTHLKLATLFDVVFLAQREYIESLTKHGIQNVYWLPLACDPEIHSRCEVPKEFEIGFAGSITDSRAHERRKFLLDSLSSEFDVNVRRVFLHEMAEHFSSGKIVFNNAIKNDLNMRVFEALCSGSMLLTDDAEGLADFFRDGKELVVYNDENIVERARYYLRHDEEREEIAKAGREKVLAAHTYDYRMEQIIKTMRSVSKRLEISPDKPDHYYRGERPEVMEMVPDSAMRILEIGCGAGATSRMLKEDNSAREVVGVEYDALAAREASKYMDRIFCGDVEKINLPYPDGYFDCIIYADVLEHLRDPEKLLQKQKKLLSKNGVMVMSIPNTRHYSLVNQLMEGRWTYEESGLLDSTHIRFFTLSEIKGMLGRCGLLPLEIKGKRVDQIYKEGANGTLKIGRWQIDNLSEEEMFEFFVFQYLLTVRSDMAEKETLKPFDPEQFREMVAKEKRFAAGSGDMLATAAQCVAKGEDEKAVELLKSLSSEADAERLLWLGHINMALGRFGQAESVYRKLGDEKYLGCSLAARGLLIDALSCWWQARSDDEAAGWVESFGSGTYGGEGTLLAAAENGDGLHFTAYDKSCKKAATSFKNLDYITSFHRLEHEEDVIGALTDYRASIRDGGVLALLCTSSSSDAKDVYPLPYHRFTPESLKKIVALIGGFHPITVVPLYDGRSFLSVFQKGEMKSNGNKFDYDAMLRVLLAKRAMEMSRAYRARDMLEASGQCADGALWFNPQNGDALTMSGDCLMKKGETTEAAAKYQKAIELDGSASSLIGIGTINIMQSDFEQAAQFFERAAAVEPENDRALCGLGISLFNLDKKEDGFDNFVNALRINPENEVALTSLVKAGYALNKLEPVERALERFLELHPANVELLFSLAGVRFHAGNKDTAKEDLDKILLFDPDHKNAIELYEKIEAATGKATI